MAKVSANKTPLKKPIAKALTKKVTSKAASGGAEKSTAFDFGGFQPDIIQLIRSLVDIAPRADEEVGEYQHTCEVFRKPKIEDDDICFAEFTATETIGKENIIRVEATYMVVITAPISTTRRQRDAFIEFYVKQIVWQRFRDFCDFAVAQGGASLPLPLAVAESVLIKTYG